MAPGTMKPTDDSEPMDWRVRLHALPRGTEPPPPALKWLGRAFVCTALFFVGVVFILISGGVVGLFRGIGPEQTGGTLYIFLGLILNLLAGTGLAAIAARRAKSRTTPRLIFYSFTAPTFLAIFLMSLSIAERLFH